MKRFIVIALTVMVIIAGVFCLNIGAEGDEPSVVISGHNLTLENNIYIVYYLQAKNIPEGAEYGLLVWTEAQDEYTYANADYRIAPVGTQTISGVIYDRFEYQNVAAKQMADNIYAMGYINDGENITYSALDKYSVLQYAANKINTTTNAKLKALLKGMLDYGTAAQTYFGYNMDRLSNATYYTVTVEGGTLSDGTMKGLYSTGKIVTFVADIDNFDHWENPAGEIIGIDKTLKIAVSGTETYRASSNTVEKRNLLVFDYIENDNGTTDVKISVKGDVNLYGLEFKLKMDLQGMEYTGHTVVASGGDANYINGEYIVLSYASTTGKNITEDIVLMTLTLNNTENVRSAVMTVYEIDSFDESFKDENVSVVGAVYSNK